MNSDISAIMAQIRAEAAVANVSIVELAKSSNTARSSLDKYLRGQRQMPLDVLYRICQVLNIEPIVIIERARERNMPRAEPHMVPPVT